MMGYFKFLLIMQQVVWSKLWTMIKFNFVAHGASHKPNIRRQAMHSYLMSGYCMRWFVMINDAILHK